MERTIAQSLIIVRYSITAIRCRIVYTFTGSGLAFPQNDK